MSAIGADEDERRVGATLSAARLAPNALRVAAREQPDRPLAVAADGTASVTYRRFDEMVDEWAVALIGLGLGPGDHVATFLPDPFTAALAWLGACRCGVLEVSLNPALRGSLLARMIDDSGAVAVVTDLEQATFLGAVAPDLPSVPRLLLTDTSADALDRADPSGDGLDRLSFAARLRDARGATPPDRPIESHDVAAMIYTSGTTGRSKGVLVPWGAVHSMWSWPPEDALRADELVYSTLPVHHLSGKSLLQAVIDRRAGWAHRERFVVDSFLDDIRRTGAVAACLVGPMTSFVAALPARPDDADSSLRAVLCGPMIPEMSQFEQRFGVQTATCYGMTEIGAVLTTGWDHGPLAGCGRVRRDFPWPEVLLVDEHDREVPPGRVGEMVVRTGAMWSLSAGYHRNPEATADAWRNGWFHTGDAFTVDAAGWFTFVDRLKDTIRRRGENISSFEVEGVIGGHPDVSECAVVGVPGAHGDDDVMAYVIASTPGGIDPSELHAWLEPRLPSLLRPRFIEVVTDLPRNATTMRILKHELRGRGPGGATFDAAAPAGTDRVDQRGAGRHGT